MPCPACPPLQSDSLADVMRLHITLTAEEANRNLSKFKVRGGGGGGILLG